MSVIFFVRKCDILLKERWLCYINITKSATWLFWQTSYMFSQIQTDAVFKTTVISYHCKHQNTAAWAQTVHSQHFIYSHIQNSFIKHIIASGNLGIMNHLGDKWRASVITPLALALSHIWADPVTPSTAHKARGLHTRRTSQQMCAAWSFRRHSHHLYTQRHTKTMLQTHTFIFTQDKRHYKVCKTLLNMEERVGQI